MSVKDQLEQASNLIREKRFEEARRLLTTIDHPKAKEWLVKLNQITSGQDSSPSPVQSSSSKLLSRENASSSPTMMASVSPIAQESKGGINLLGILLLLITAIVGGVAVGAGLHFSGRFVYLIFASVFLAALLAGFFMKTAVRIGKVRNQLVVIVFSILMGLVAYGSLRYGDYLWFQEEVRSSVRETDPRATNDEIDTFTDIILQDETGATGFEGFIRLEAQEGLSISSSRNYTSTNDEGLVLSEPITIGYWIIEILIMIGVPLMAGLSQTKEIFCDSNNDWLHFVTVGSVSQADWSNFLQALQVSDFQTARTFIAVNGDFKRPYLNVEKGDCGAEQPTGILRVTSMSTDRRGRADNQKILEMTLARSTYNIITKV